MSNQPHRAERDGCLGHFADWDRRFAQVAARPSAEGVAELLLQLAADLERLRLGSEQPGEHDQGCELRWQRLAQLSSVHSLAAQVATQRCLAWLVVLLTVLLPPALVASIYGMNFSPHASPWAMPELFFYWGYPAVLLIMGGLMLLALLALRRARWLGLPKTPPGQGHPRR